jgi:hypothetical protein
MSGTGIRSNPNTDRGSVFGGSLYQTLEYCNYPDFKWPNQITLVHFVRISNGWFSDGHIYVKLTIPKLDFSRFWNPTVFLWSIIKMSRIPDIIEATKIDLFDLIPVIETCFSGSYLNIDFENLVCVKDPVQSESNIQTSLIMERPFWPIAGFSISG